MGLDPGALGMSDAIVTPELTQRLADGEIARRALKWMMEHRIYWDQRYQRLLQPVSLVGQTPFILPPADVALYLFELSREVDLEAEHAR